MADRRAGNRSMGRRGRTKLETGTCNVCSAPCSSCMHRNAGFTGSKSDESSDENSHGVVASQSSFNENDLLRTSGVNALGRSHNSASGMSNLVNLDHDAFSENAESREIIRCCDTSGGPIKRSRRDQDSMRVNSCNVLPKEGDSQSSRSLLSDHQAKNILGQGNFKKKSGAEDNEKQKNISIKNSKHPDQSGMVGKSGENISLDEADEPDTSYMSESESESAESVDVKVCDICGDAGREDLLATCSRCSDGAEHTYCMRVMLHKVPQGDWLCEECKFAEEAEKRKLELELKYAEAKRKRESEVNLNTQSSSKRHIDKSEAAPDAKRQAVEALTGSPKRSVLPRLPTLSRETSFKGLEKTKRKLAHHSSFNSHSSDDTESIRSTDSQLKSPKGSLLKSSSFSSSSSRPKVRPVDDVMLPRQKTRKENASLDVKDRFARNVDKSMSARSIDVGNSRGTSSVVYANSPRDLKNLHSDGRQGSLTKQARHLSRNHLEDIAASVGDTSTREKCSSGEQVLSEAKRKDEVINLDGLPRLREIRETGEKSKDTVGNRQRSDMLSGLKGLTQKGQNAEPGTSFASGSNLPTTQNNREDINKGNRLRAAVDAALRKKHSFSKNRGLEQSDLPPVSNVDSSCDKASQNLPSKAPVVRDWPVGLQVSQGGHPNLRTDSQSTAVNGRQYTLAGADAVAASQSVEPEVHFPSVKPVMRDLPVVAPTASAIPKPDYIWQGDLEVQKSRYLSVLHCGIQAHLSTLASPKVAEVANQFPVKVTLNEVPRLSTWPAQFQDTGAMEDHVALFFFAKDNESFENSYKPLVDNMVQKDLALKGNLQGAELLIFPSNQLPQNYQRWNMFFYLWGVFRGKLENCSNPLKNIPLSVSNNLPNMGKAFSTREGFCHENPSNSDQVLGTMQSSKKEENAKENEACGAINKGKALFVTNGDRGAVEETEEGEIGGSPHFRDEKTSGPRTVNPPKMIQKVDLDDLRNEGLCEGPVKKKLKTGSRVGTECSISTMDTFGSRKSGFRPCEEEKKHNAPKRIVLPLDLNDRKVDDDEIVESTPRALGNENPKLTSGEEKTRTSSINKRRSSSSHRRHSQMLKPEDDTASLSRSLSFSSLRSSNNNSRTRDRRLDGNRRSRV